MFSYAYKKQRCKGCGCHGDCWWEQDDGWMDECEMTPDGICTWCLDAGVERG